MLEYGPEKSRGIYVGPSLLKSLPKIPFCEGGLWPPSQKGISEKVTIFANSVTKVSAIGLALLPVCPYRCATNMIHDAAYATFSTLSRQVLLRRQKYHRFLFRQQFQMLYMFRFAARTKDCPLTACHISRGPLVLTQGRSKRQVLWTIESQGGAIIEIKTAGWRSVGLIFVTGFQLISNWGNGVLIEDAFWRRLHFVAKRCETKSIPRGIYRRRTRIGCESRVEGTRQTLQSKFFISYRWWHGSTACRLHYSSFLKLIVP